MEIDFDAGRSVSFEKRLVEVCGQGADFGGGPSFECYELYPLFAFQLAQQDLFVNGSKKGIVRGADRQATEMGTALAFETMMGFVMHCFQANAVSGTEASSQCNTDWVFTRQTTLSITCACFVSLVRNSNESPTKKQVHPITFSHICSHHFSISHIRSFFASG